MSDLYQHSVDLGKFVSRGGYTHTDGIIAASAYADANGYALVSQPWVFTIEADVVLPPNSDLRLATFNVYNGATVSIGSPGAATFNASYYLPKIVNAGTQWTGTGVRIDNLYSCHVTIANIVGFGIGVDLAAHDALMNAYNTYYPGYLENNLVNMRLRPRSRTGAVNENVFIGGRFMHYSGAGTIAESRHIQIIPHDYTDAAGSWPNNNLFIKPSIEGDRQEQHVEIGGSYNRIVNGRYESNPPLALLKGHSNAAKVENNAFDGGYGVQNIVFTNEGVVRRTMVSGPSGITMSPSGIPLNIANGHSGAEPLLQGFAAGVEPVGKDHTATDWGVRLAYTGLQGKRDADASARAVVDFQNGKFWCGDGSNAAMAGFRHYSNGIVQADGVWRFATGGLVINGKAVAVDPITGVLTAL